MVKFIITLTTILSLFSLKAEAQIGAIVEFSELKNFKITDFGNVELSVDSTITNFSEVEDLFRYVPTIRDIKSYKEIYWKGTGYDSLVKQLSSQNTIKLDRVYTLHHMIEYENKQGEHVGLAKVSYIFRNGEPLYRVRELRKVNNNWLFVNSLSIADAVYPFVLGMKVEAIIKLLSSPQPFEDEILTSFREEILTADNRINFPLLVETVGINWHYERPIEKMKYFLDEYFIPK